MAEEIVESGPQEGSAGSQPVASQKEGDKPTSPFDAEKLLAQVGTLVEQSVEKKLQSMKDRRFDTMEKFQKEYQPVLDKVKDLIPPEQFAQIQKDMEFDEIKRRVLGDTPTSAPELIGNQQKVSAVDNAAKVLDELKLDAKDAEVAKKLGEIGLENPKLREEMAIFALQNRPQPTISPSQAAAIKGSVSAPDDIQSKLKQLRELQILPSKNKAAIEKLTAELDAVNWGGLT